MPEQVQNFNLYVNYYYYKQHYIEFDRAFNHLDELLIVPSSNQPNAYVIKQANINKVQTTFHNLEQETYEEVGKRINQPNLAQGQSPSPANILADIIFENIPAGKKLWIVKDSDNKVIEEYTLPIFKPLTDTSLEQVINDTTNCPPIPWRYNLPFYGKHKTNKVLEQLLLYPDTKDNTYASHFLDDYLGIRLVKYRIVNQKENHLLIYCRQFKTSRIQRYILNKLLNRDVLYGEFPAVSFYTNVPSKSYLFNLLANHSTGFFDISHLMPLPGYNVCPNQITNKSRYTVFNGVNIIKQYSPNETITTKPYH